jgi:hypothetical protein
MEAAHAAVMAQLGRTMLGGVVIGMLLVGCGISTKSTMLREPPQTAVPRGPEAVEVFSGGRPPRSHVDVALIESEQETAGSDGDTAEIIWSMREEAGKLGCDGIILGGVSSRIDTLTSFFSDTTHDRKALSGTCIVYTDEATSGR